MSSGEAQPWTSSSIPMIEPDELLGVLAAASDLAIMLKHDGRIISVIVNDKTTQLGKLDHWLGRPLADFLAQDSKPKLASLLKRVAADEPLPQHVEFNHIDNAAWPYPLRYSVHPVGRDGGVLLLGHDMRQVAETQQQLVQAQIALERGYEERREYDARYRMLMTLTRDAFALVGVADGRIRDLNPPAADLLGASREDLQGVVLAQEFQDRKRGEFIDTLVNSALSDAGAPMALRTQRSGRQVMVMPSLFRAAGERLVFCRFDVAESTRGTDDRLTTHLNALFRRASDAFVFTDMSGVIEFTNEAFVELVDYAHLVDLRGRSLADYLARGQIDLATMLENAARAGRMRVYMTKITNEFGNWTPVEISVSHLNNRNRPAVGFVIRDASRSEAMRPPAAGGPDDGVNHNVVELVGSTSLKEIVAETSDVIERMCIETALELTRDNRAAAAEMLGLSRQSLYVKLRKYDILGKDAQD